MHVVSCTEQEGEEDGRQNASALRLGADFALRDLPFHLISRSSCQPFSEVRHQVLTWETLVKWTGQHSCSSHALYRLQTKSHPDSS